MSRKVTQERSDDMGQAKLIAVKKGQARVIIKSNPQDRLPTFELDWEFSKSDAIKIMVYAMQLKGKE